MITGLSAWDDNFQTVGVEVKWVAGLSTVMKLLPDMNEVNEPWNIHTCTHLQVSQVDHENVQATALKTVFDLIHVYGLEAFSSHAQPAAAGEPRTSSDQISTIGEPQVCARG